jgi:rare lipoprotein A (peptidoglycan hydrolase)/uncharacterized protein YkwD
MVMKKISASLSFLLIGGIMFFSPLGNAEETTGVNQPFSDVDPYSAYYDATLYLKNKGVIEGYEDGTFKPTQKVNRAEALKIILLGSQKEIPEPHTPLPFPDTGSGAWYTPYIATGLSLGIVQGYPDGTFKPEQTVNKVESLKMLLKTKNIIPPTVSLTDPPLFHDTPITPSTLWYQPFVFYARQTNIVEPVTVNMFGPADAMTRGQVAVMMYRLVYIQEHHLDSFDTSQTGIASYYGSGLEGHGTSSGESFSNNDFSCAHRYLPFNTFLEVINTATGVSTVVKVNDRGPYVEKRIVDLSQAAFAAIDKLSHGLTNVKIRNLGVIPELTKSYISPETFSDNTNGSPGVVLDHTIPNIFFPNEIYTITGKTAQNTQTVTALIKNKSTKKEILLTTNVSNQRFTLPIMLTEEGAYSLNIIPDTLGIGYADLFVTNPSYFENKTFLPNNNSPLTPQIQYANGKTIISFDPNGNTIFKIHVQQGDQEIIFYVNNASTIEVPYALFSDFKQETTHLFIEGARSSTSFSIDRYTTWAPSPTISFIPVQHEYEIYQKDAVVLMPYSTTISGNTLHLTGTAKTTLEQDVWYTLPSGKVGNVPLSKNTIIHPNDSFSFDIPITEQGTYIVEINSTNGEAVFNVPFYTSSIIPVLPNPRDKISNRNMMTTFHLFQERTTMVERINQERAKLNIAPLILDINANNLAQARSDDMAMRNYFSHVTPEGNTIEHLKTEYGLNGSIGENLAKDNNTTLALYGLFRSPAHRRLLISETFTKIGIGLSKAMDGQIIVTQILY